MSIEKNLGGENSGGLSDKIGLGQKLNEAPAGDRGGSMSDEIDMEQTKTIAQLDKQIAGYEQLVANMTASGENADPQELEDARDNLAELRRKRSALISNAD